eukprot:1043518-Prorocentrum_lima.AAC.1
MWGATVKGAGPTQLQHWRARLWQAVGINRPGANTTLQIRMHHQAAKHDPHNLYHATVVKHWSQAVRH